MKSKSKKSHPQPPTPKSKSLPIAPGWTTTSTREQELIRSILKSTPSHATHVREIQKSNKRTREEVELEDELFGTGVIVKDDAPEDTVIQSNTVEDDDSDALEFEIDTTPSTTDPLPTNLTTKSDQISLESAPKALWTDESILESGTEDRLRSKYLSLHPTPSWAQPGNAQETPSHESIRGQDILSNQQPKLTFINHLEQAPSAICSLSTHRWAPLLATLDASNSLRIFHLDAQHNPKLQGFTFESEQVTACAFVNDHTLALCGRFNTLQLYNLEKAVLGRCHAKLEYHQSFRAIQMCPNWSARMFAAAEFKAQTIHLFDERRMKSVAKLSGPSLGRDGPPASFAWSRDGKKMWTFDHTKGGFLLWDVGMRKVIKTMRCSSLAGKDISCLNVYDPFVVVGSMSGVVEVYERERLMEVEDREVVKASYTYDKLTTSVVGVPIHPSGKMMAPFSDRKKLGLRLMSTDNMKSILDFPPPYPHLGCVSAVGFTSYAEDMTRMDGTYLAVGNLHGRTSLFSIGR